jgi:hypothetical protein
VIFDILGELDNHYFSKEHTKQCIY